MPKRLQVSQLPGPTLQELQSRLIENNFSNFVELSLWLKGEGHNISKSAIHRYSQEMKDSVASPESGRSASGDADLRMRCIEVAARSTSVPIDTINLAEQFFFWVTTGRRP